MLVGLRSRSCATLLGLVVDSSIHPDTGEPIFLPFRMSGKSHSVKTYSFVLAPTLNVCHLSALCTIAFVPTNLIVCVSISSQT